MADVRKPTSDGREALSIEQKRRMLAERLAARVARRYPLSPTQGRFWFFETLEPGTPVLHISFRLRVAPAPDATSFEAALNELAQRHETLRTRIEVADGEALQVVEPRPRVAFTIRDVPEVGAAAADTASRIFGDFVRPPFDLERGPLWRVMLLRDGDGATQLMVVIHHLISDGLSLSVFLRDLQELYRARVERRAALLPPLTIQYGEYAERQRADAARIGTQLDYWRKNLADAPPSTGLPADNQRHEAERFRGGSVAADVPEELVHDLRELGRRTGATLFMTLLAAFKVQLARLTGATDVVVGTPVGGRTSADLEPLIGVFINTLALRTHLDGDPAFEDVIRRVRDTALGAYAHQDLPFDSIVAELKPGHRGQGTPVFNVLFNMLGSGVRPETDTAAFIDDQETASKFDLTMYVTPRGAGMALRLAYAADIFLPGRIHEMLRQYVHLLRQCVDGPSRRISEFDCVTPAARSVLPDPGEPLAIAAPSISIARAARERVVRSASRHAVVDDRVTLSYADLGRRAESLAGYLARAGVRPGSVVAVYAHRNAALPAVLLGVVLSGAAFCLLDPAWPARRLVACVEAADPILCIHCDGAGPMPDTLRAAFDARRRPCPRTEAVWDTSTPVAEPEPEVEAAERLAYVAFTSGTTGGLKALHGTEAPLTHFLDWHVRTFALTEGDRFSMLSGLGHDPLLRDIFTPLRAGGTLVVPDDELIHDGVALARWMHDWRITVAHLTPQHAMALAAGAEQHALVLTSLRYLFFGGDVLSRETIALMRRIAPHATCVNFYGATETPQAMSYWVASDEESAPVIGRGIDGVQILVVTDNGRLAGIGEPGEIWVRTPYLTAGYANDRALTAERFIRNPFSTNPADRIYRTGDVGRFRPDGQVEFVGRRDRQVKIRGFRVELAEVEQALRDHPAVRDSVVVVRTGAGGQQELAAAVVPVAGEALTAMDLRSFLAGRIPSHAVPARFDVMASLPLTPNGKVDRRLLGQLPEQPRTMRAAAVPITPTQKAVAAVFGEVLRVQAVGIDDSFFDLGGHSLVAGQVVWRLRARLGVDVPLRTLFDAPTVAALAARIDAVGPRATDHEEIEF